MTSHAERRERNVAREVRWIARHPRLSGLILWWALAMVAGEALLALSYVASGQWGAAAFYAGAIGVVSWLAHRWAGEVREAGQIDEAERA